MFNPRNEYNRGIDRSDIRWYHPELADAPGTEIVLGDNPTSIAYDPDITVEEKLRIITEATAQATEAFSPVELPEDIIAQFESRKVQIPGCPEEEDAPLVTAEVLTPPVKPRSKKKRHRAILFAVGGSLIQSNPWISPLHSYAMTAEAVVVAPHYRNALQAPYPAALNDLHATYKWMVEHADELNIDPDNIALLAQSSGSHLSAALAFRLKRYGYHPRGAVLMEAIMEDRPIYHSQQLANTFWTGTMSNGTNALYLREQHGNPLLGPEAYANRATVEDCKGLCPFFIHTSEFDSESDSCMAFSMKLREAGVYTELHQWGGSTHGLLNMLGLTTEYSKRYRNQVMQNLIDCLTYDLRRLDLMEE
ncbi:MAG: alpha/beta hydrolase [Bariatricus sp.]